MIQYISEFGLPKEFSKKKKFDILIGMHIPQTEWKAEEVNWSINMDLQKVFLTVEECTRDVIEQILNNGIHPDELQDSYIAIAAFTYPITSLNETPIARDLHNNPIDCNFSKDTLSFNFTFRDTTWESISVSTLKIGTIATTMEENGHIKITDFKVYPVIDNTLM